MTALTDSLALLDTPTLRRMADRAYRDAARSWAEYRAEPRTSPIRPMLRSGAESADTYYQDPARRAHGGHPAA